MAEKKWLDGFLAWKAKFAQQWNECPWWPWWRVSPNHRSPSGFPEQQNENAHWRFNHNYNVFPSLNQSLFTLNSRSAWWMRCVIQMCNLMWQHTLGGQQQQGFLYGNGSSSIALQSCLADVLFILGTQFLYLGVLRWVFRVRYAVSVANNMDLEGRASGFAPWMVVLCILPCSDLLQWTNKQTPNIWDNSSLLLFLLYLKLPSQTGLNPEKSCQI